MSKYFCLNALLDYSIYKMNAKENLVAFQLLLENIQQNLMKTNNP